MNLQSLRLNQPRKDSPTSLPPIEDINSAPEEPTLAPLPSVEEDTTTEDIPVELPQSLKHLIQ